MTKSNVAGYVAAFPIPEVVMGINAFARGMRSVNPKAEVKVIWVNSWFDPGREREAADTLISQGADVVTHHTDSTAAVQAAEAKKVYAVGYHSDMSKYGPNAQLTAVTHQWGDYYTKVAQAQLDGKWKPGNVWGGIKEGMIKMAPFNKVVPQDVQDLVNKTEADIGAGKFHPVHRPGQGQRGQGAPRRRQDDRRRRRCRRWTTTSRACRASCPSSPPGEPAPRPRRPPSELAPERPGPFFCLAPCPDGWAAERRAAARCELSDRDRSRSRARGRGNRWWLPALPLRRSAFRRARRRSPVRRRFPR